MKKRGITRKKHGSGKRFSWEYFDSHGQRITSQKIIERCNKLVLAATSTGAILVPGRLEAILKMGAPIAVSSSASNSFLSTSQTTAAPLPSRPRPP